MSTDRREVDSLIAYARDVLGAGLEVNTDPEGRIESITVRGVAGVGRHPMPPLAFAERMRAVQAERLALCVSMLQARFPQLGISHGYIGNVGMIGNKYVDDRSWRVFTNMRDVGLGYSVSVHLDGPGEFNVLDVAHRLVKLAAVHKGLNV